MPDAQLDILDRMRNQYAVYWPPAGIGEQARMEYGTPRELRVRWEDIQEVFVDSTGRESRSSARVFVGERLENEGVLWRGRLSQVPRATGNNPFALAGAFRIRKFDEVPLLEPESDADYVRTAWL